MGERTFIQKMISGVGLVSKSELNDKIRKIYQSAESTSRYEESEGKLKDTSQEDQILNYRNHIWVYAAVWAIANAGAAVPFKIFKISGEERKDVEPDHPAMMKLRRPNPFYSYFDLVEATLSGLELTGNGYWQLDHETEKLKDGKDITGIYALRPDCVTVLPDPEKLIKGFRYKVKGSQAVTFTPEEVINFKYYNPTSDFYGMSPIQPMANSIITDYYATAWNKNSFKGLHSDGYLSVEQEIDEAQGRRISSEWERKYSGPTPKQKVPVLGKGAKYNELNRSPKEMEFIEQKRMSREEILAGYGVPPIMVGLLEYSSYANAQSQKKTFYLDTLIPKMMKLEYQINNQLIWPFFGKDLLFAYDYSKIDVLQEDIAQIATAATGLVASGIMTSNEVRKKFFNLDDVSWGDKWYKSPMLEAVEEAYTQKADYLVPDGRGEMDAEVVSQEVRKKKEKTKYDFWRKITFVAEPYEKPFANRVKKIFAGAEEEVINNLESKISKQAIHIPLGSLLYDQKKIIAQLAKMSKPIYLDVISAAGDEIFDFLKVTEQFGERSREVSKFLSTTPFKFADEVNETTITDLQNTLKEGMAANEEIGQLTNRVRHVFDGTVRGEAPRAQVIARTECMAANNFGINESFRQAGVTQREWLANFDLKTRHDHLVASGQRVGMDEPFIVGGERLMYPGDKNGSAGNVIQCRCTVFPVMVGKEPVEV